jgi:hypothetical protein
LSEGESDIRPRLDLTINAQTMQAAGDAAAVPRELWPWLALAALGLLVIEWVVYCVRVRRGAGTALP